MVIATCHMHDVATIHGGPIWLHQIGRNAMDSA
jgi:hypothetical protein